MAATDSDVLYFHFPHPVRVVRYFATPGVSEAADATKAVVVVFQDGATTLATLTNDTDTADDIDTDSAAWVQHTTREINTEDRPGSPTPAENTPDAIAAGHTIKVTVTKAAGTATGFMSVGMEVKRST
jgi:hypothetical protein